MDRGQLITLEALISSLLLLAVLAFAIQSMAVVPSATAVEQEWQQTHQHEADHVLRVTATDGTLQQAVRAWDPTTGENTSPHFHGSDPTLGYYSSLQQMSEHNPLGTPLLLEYQSDHLAINVELVERAGTVGERHTVLLSMGTPSELSIVATYPLVIYSDESIVGGPGNGTRLGSLAADEFWTSTDGGDDLVHAVIEVRLTVWVP